MSVDANGQYEPYLPADPAQRRAADGRTNDGIHMTIPGYIYAMRGLSDRIRGSIAQARAPGRPCRTAGRPGRQPAASARSSRAS